MLPTHAANTQRRFSSELGQNIGAWDIGGKTVSICTEGDDPEWRALDSSTNETHTFPMAEETSTLALSFLSNFDQSKCEELKRHFRPILESDDDGRITNIALHCFSEANPGKVITQEKGAVTVILAEDRTPSSQENSIFSFIFACIREYIAAGRPVLWCERLNAETCRKESHFLYTATKTGSMIPGLTALPTIDQDLAGKDIKARGPTWLRSAEKIQQLENAVKANMNSQKYAQLDMLGYPFDTVVAAVVRLYANYAYILPKYVGPFFFAASVFCTVDSMVREEKRHSASDIAATVRFLGAVGVITYAVSEGYSRFGMFLCRKTKEWQNRDRTDENPGTHMGWVRHQLTKLGITFELPMLNFIPNDVIRHLNSNGAAATLSKES